VRKGRRYKPLASPHRRVWGETEGWNVYHPIGLVAMDAAVSAHEPRSSAYFLIAPKAGARRERHATESLARIRTAQYDKTLAGR
jgi:hypothetical protein